MINILILKGHRIRSIKTLRETGSKKLFFRFNFLSLFCQLKIDITYVSN